MKLLAQLKGAFIEAPATLSQNRKQSGIGFAIYLGAGMLVFAVILQQVIAHEDDFQTITAGLFFPEILAWFF